MAVVNPVLMISGADAAKSASYQPPPASVQPDSSESFASALRKHLPVAQNTVLPAPVTAPQARQPRADAGQPATPPADANQQTAAADTSAADHDYASATSDGATAAPQSPRKKTTARTETDPLQNEAAMAPWMQNMLAMRPPAAAGNAASNVAAAVSAEPAITATDPLLITPLTAPAITDGNPATTVADLPLGASPVADSAAEAATTTTARPLFDQAFQAAFTPVTTDPAPNGASETLQLATQAGGQSPGLTAFDDQMTLVKGAADSTVVTLPLSVAMPASPWANTAGLQANSQVLTAQISVPFGQERWQAALNQQVMHMVGSSDEVASLTLSPPDLGPIQVVLKVDNQSVNTSFVTDNPLVRKALEDGMQDLRQRMESQGLQLGQTFVGDGQQAQQHFAQTARNVSVAGGQGEGESTAPTAIESVSLRPRSTPLGIVDTFV